MPDMENYLIEKNINSVFDFFYKEQQKKPKYLKHHCQKKNREKGILLYFKTVVQNLLLIFVNRTFDVGFAVKILNLNNLVNFIETIDLRYFCS